MSMLTSLRRGLLMLLCGLAVTAPVASAQDDEIFVDPESPTGKEYELPIDRAREQAAPTTRKRSSRSAAPAAPLFGEGVEPERAGTPAPDRTRETRAARQEKAAGANATDAATLSRARGDREARAAAPEGGAGLVAIVAAAAAVLLVGGLLGLLLRRRAAP